MAPPAVGKPRQPAAQDCSGPRSRQTAKASVVSENPSYPRQTSRSRRPRAVRRVPRPAGASVRHKNLLPNWELGRRTRRDLDGSRRWSREYTLLAKVFSDRTADVPKTPGQGACSRFPGKMLNMCEMRLHDASGRRLYFGGEERAAPFAAARRQPARDRTLCGTLHWTGCRPSQLLEFTPLASTSPAARHQRSESGAGPVSRVRYESNGSQTSRPPKLRVSTLK